MTILLIIGLVVCTFLSGFFSGSETALFSIPGSKMRAFRVSARPKERLVHSLLKHPRELLVTILMVNVLVNLLVQNFASSLFADVPGWTLKVGLPLLLTLLFGEIIPKTLALPNNVAVGRLVSGPIGGCHRILGPVRRGLTRVAGTVSRVMFFALEREEELNAEELSDALVRSQEAGLLTHDEAELVKGYLAFQTVSVKEQMRPREEMITFDRRHSLKELAQLFRTSQVSRIPIYDGDPEKIIGVIEAHDFFLTNDLSGLKKPFFVPETMEASRLLHKLDERDEDLAIAIDEYGSVAGLISREDLVEVIVGEIADRRDVKRLYTRAGSDVIIASGKLEISELNELFGTTIASEGAIATIGGYLTEQLGELPKAGTRFQTEELFFHVLAAEPNRVRRVYIRRCE